MKVEPVPCVKCGQLPEIRVEWDDNGGDYWRGITIHKCNTFAIWGERCRSKWAATRSVIRRWNAEQGYELKRRARLEER